MAEAPVIWLACDCYVWPLTPLHGFARCARCGVRPHTPVDAPPDGKAHPL